MYVYMYKNQASTLHLILAQPLNPKCLKAWTSSSKERLGFGAKGLGFMQKVDELQPLAPPKQLRKAKGPQDYLGREPLNCTNPKSPYLDKPLWEPFTR